MSSFAREQEGMDGKYNVILSYCDGELNRQRFR